MGYANVNGEVSITNKFLSVESFNASGLALVTIPTTTIRQKADYWISEMGQKYYRRVDLNPKYNFFSRLDTIQNEQVITFCKMGLINSKGEYVVKPEWNFIKLNDNSKLSAGIVISDSTYGVINTEGKFLLPPIYDGIDEVFNANNNYIFNKNGHYGLMNTDGKILLDTLYSEIANVSYSSENLYSVGLNNKYGLVNNNGKWVLTPEYSQISHFASYTQFFMVTKDNKTGMIDLNGKVLIPTQYYYFEDFKNSLIRVSKDNKYGILNLKGEVLIPVEYDEISYDEHSIFLSIIAKNRNNETQKKTYSLQMNLVPVD